VAFVERAHGGDEADREAARSRVVAGLAEAERLAEELHRAHAITTSSRLPSAAKARAGQGMKRVSPGDMRLCRPLALALVLLAPIAPLACRSHAPSEGECDQRAFAPPPVASAPPPAPEPVGPVGALVNFTDGFAAVVARVRPAVVSIQASHTGPTLWGLPGATAEDEPPTTELLASPDPVLSGVARGSGVIVSTDGYVLTNHHVVAGADRIRVVLFDRRDLPARLVGSDAHTDIAVLKIEADRLAPAPLADSSKVRVGQFALAMGNPFGVGQTVTLGIIGAVRRGRMGITDYEDFLQTDAAINPGNSGGPLVDVEGRVIGVNTAILTTGGGGNEGVGFAVPSDLARGVMDQLVREGHVIRGWLGVAVEDVSPADAAARGGSVEGALIGEVTPGGPAAKAGLERGDILAALNGEPIADGRALRLRIAQLPPGSTARLDVIRGGQHREITAKLGQLRER
jgi:serine protease Do